MVEARVYPHHLAAPKQQAADRIQLAVEQRLLVVLVVPAEPLIGDVQRQKCDAQSGEPAGVHHRRSRRHHQSGAKGPARAAGAQPCVRSASIQFVDQGYGVVSGQAFPSTNPDYVAELDDYYPYDPEKVKALLANAGYGEG